MKRNKFSLSHYKLATFDMAELVPLTWYEVKPGDTVQMSTSLLLRVSPLLAPVMHPVRVKVHHWYVPYRLLWEKFESFRTGGEDGMDASAFPTCGINLNQVTGTLSDYLGIPTNTGQTGVASVSVLPYRAYSMIWNENYRDQDLQPPVVVSKASGGDNTTNKTLLKASWEKDYFTTARPFTQKGPEVVIPVGTTAPIKGMGTTISSGTPVSAVRETGGVTRDYPFAKAADNQMFMEMTAASGAFPSVFADLSTAAGVSINDLRFALALQRFQEMRARFGGRYTEFLASMGIRSSDARLQRPEYLGGGRATIQFSEVLQTGPNDPGQGQSVGALKGHGIGAMRSNRFRRFFEEDGIVMTLCYVMPKTMYMNGLHRSWNRRVKEDFHNRELEHVGQQGVLNKEVYLTADGGTENQIWGYQDKYDEYRHMESSVSGEFRTTVLDFWHMARSFASPPVLNASFIEGNPTKRIHQVATNDVLWVMANHSIQARRILSKTGTSFIF